jgi:MFS family permease
LLQPSINSLITRSVAADEVGGTLGISAALLSGANAFAPVLGGQLFQGLGSGAPFWIGGVIAAILFALALRLLPRRSTAPTHT